MGKCKTCKTFCYWIGDIQSIFECCFCLTQKDEMPNKPCSDCEERIQTNKFDKLIEEKWDYIFLKCCFADKKLPLNEEEFNCIIFQLLLFRSEREARKEWEALTKSLK